MRTAGMGLEEGQLQRLESTINKGKSLSFRCGIRKRVVFESEERIFIPLYRVVKKNLPSWHNYVAHDCVPEEIYTSCLQDFWL
jgi:hypothetical protein